MQSGSVSLSWEGSRSSLDPWTDIDSLARAAEGPALATTGGRVGSRIWQRPDSQPQHPVTHQAVPPRTDLKGRNRRASGGPETFVPTRHPVGPSGRSRSADLGASGRPAYLIRPGDSGGAAPGPILVEAQDGTSGRATRPDSFRRRSGARTIRLTGLGDGRISPPHGPAGAVAGPAPVFALQIKHSTAAERRQGGRKERAAGQGLARRPSRSAFGQRFGFDALEEPDARPGDQEVAALEGGPGPGLVFGPAGAHGAQRPSDLTVGQDTDHLEGGQFGGEGVGGNSDVVHPLRMTDPAGRRHRGRKERPAGQAGQAASPSWASTAAWSAGPSAAMAARAMAIGSSTGAGAGDLRAAFG
jgi:hypothetical protein